MAENHMSHLRQSRADSDFEIKGFHNIDIRPKSYSLSVVSIRATIRSRLDRPASIPQPAPRVRAKVHGHDLSIEQNSYGVHASRPSLFPRCPRPYHVPRDA